MLKQITKKPCWIFFWIYHGYAYNMDQAVGTWIQIAGNKCNDFKFYDVHILIHVQQTF